MITEIARAKVNLCLHVTGRRADGYHLLDSLVAFASFGDELRLSEASELSLTIRGPFAGDLPVTDDNLVLRAARAAGATARIELIKNVPVASGIGGGSADAAACLRGLQKLGYPLPDDAALVQLGADVPVCVAQQASRMRGVGEILDPVSDWPDLPVLLVNPGVAVSTPEVFSNLASAPFTPMEWPVGTDALAWLRAQRNDLQDAAIGLCPEIALVLDALHNAGAELARMSGSGATCFSVFGKISDAERAATALARNGWWVQPTILGGATAPTSR